MKNFHMFRLGTIALLAIATITACSPAAEQATPGESAQTTSEAVPEAAPETTPEVTLPSLPQAASYPRKPLDLADQAEPGSDFYQFRERLRQAIAARDAGYVKSIAAPGIRLSFGDPTTLDEVGINDPDAQIWKDLEKAIGTGCRKDEVSDAAAPETWVCPQVFEMGLEGVAIVGENVSVYAEPNRESAAVGTASNEELQFDTEAFEQLSAGQEGDAPVLKDWTPVILPSGDRGYVERRYAYAPLDYRAFFRKTDSGWSMDAFVAGD